MSTVMNTEQEGSTLYLQYMQNTKYKGNNIHNAKQQNTIFYLATVDNYSFVIKFSIVSKRLILISEQR